MTPSSGRKGAMRPDRRRDVVEAAPYGEFIRRALRAYGRRVGDGEIEELRELVRLRDDLDRIIAQAVAELRAEPHAHSWQAIADVLGITRQAAMARWPLARGARRPGGQPARLR
jgi:hypothetical protein